MLSALVIESFLHMKQKLLAELLAEFLGTMVLILFGTGVVAMVVLFGHGLPGEIVNGGYTNITLAWGLAVNLWIFITRKNTRAHTNTRGTIKIDTYFVDPCSATISPHISPSILP